MHTNYNLFDEFKIHKIFHFFKKEVVMHCAYNFNYEVNTVAIFFDHLVQGKVESHLLREMIKFTAITQSIPKTHSSVDLTFLFHDCLRKSKLKQTAIREAFEKKIILFICAKNVLQGTLRIPPELLQLISATAAIQYSIMVNKDKADCKMLLKPHAIYLKKSPRFQYLDLGVVDVVTKILETKKNKLPTEKLVQEVLLFCSFIEGKTTKESYRSGMRILFPGFR